MEPTGCLLEHSLLPVPLLLGEMRCAFPFRRACSRGLLTRKHSADTRLVGYMILPAQAYVELTALVPLDPNLLFLIQPGPVPP